MTSIQFHRETPKLNILSQIKATNIYLPPSVFVNNVFDPTTITEDKLVNIGKVWATGNYYLSTTENTTSIGPSGKRLKSGQKIPSFMAGMLLREYTIGGNTYNIPVPFDNSFPNTVINPISYGTADNITLHQGFKVITTKSGTEDPNNNSNSYISIPGNDTES